MPRQRLKEKALFLKLKITKSPDVFAEIYDLYVSRIYRFIYFKVPTKEEAEDLTSEVFLRTWKYLGNDKNVDNLNAFLYRIARNIVIDFYRKKSSKEILASDEILAKIEDTRKNIMDMVGVDIEMKNVEKGLLELKDEYREVILLRYIEELGITEIAQILEKSNAATRVLLHRALKILKEIIGS